MARSWRVNDPQAERAEPSAAIAMDMSASTAPSLLPLTAAPGVYSSYRYRNVAIIFWTGTPTAESLELFMRGAARICAEHPEGLSAVNVVVPGDREMPGPEARAGFAKIASTYGKNIVNVAIVFDVVGFWASALRGMLTAVRLVIPRQQYKVQFFHGLEHVPGWLASRHMERTGVMLTPEELRCALLAAEAQALGNAVAPSAEMST